MLGAVIIGIAISCNMLPVGSLQARLSWCSNPRTKLQARYFPGLATTRPCSGSKQTSRAVHQWSPQPPSSFPFPPPPLFPPLPIAAVPIELSPLTAGAASPKLSPKSLRSGSTCLFLEPAPPEWPSPSTKRLKDSDTDFVPVWRP